MVNVGFSCGNGIGIRFQNTYQNPILYQVCTFYFIHFLYVYLKNLFCRNVELEVWSSLYSDMSITLKHFRIFWFFLVKERKEQEKKAGCWMLDDVMT